MRDSQSSSSWGPCPGVHHHHCQRHGCCSDQSCLPSLHEPQRKLLHPLATSVNCTCSCLYPKNLHVGPNCQMLSHGTVGKKTITNTIKISTFCSRIFFPLVQAVLSGMSAHTKCHGDGAVSYLSAAASQPSPIKGWGTESDEPGGKELTATSLSKGHRSTSDRRINLKLLENGMVMLPLRDVMGSLCQNLTILLPVREGRTLAQGHPRPHRCWAPEVEPLPVGIKPLPRAWHWLAGASVAVPPGFTVLTRLSDNWHGSLLIVTACMYASRTIPGPLNKLSTAVSRWLFFLPTQYYLFIF